MRELIELLQVIAWPVTTLAIVFVLRAELKNFTKNIADRIQTASSVVIGQKGIELKGLIVAVPADVQARKVKFRRFVAGLTERSELDAIADVLKVAKSADAPAQRRGILLEMARLVSTKQEMDELSAQLKSITKQDF
jgi:hypothetical protein